MNGSSNNNYTYKDIQRYHSGEMSAEEMHQLEKAALNDPFLSDALEGYKNSHNAEGDLNTLKTRIKEKANKKTSIAWINRNNNWLKVAAVLLLIAIGGWFFVISNKSSNKNIAIHQDSTTKTNQLTTSRSFSEPKDTTKNYNDSISGYAYHTEIKKQVHKIFDRKAASNSVALNKSLQPKNELRNNEVTSAPIKSNEIIEPVNKNDNLKGKAAQESKDLRSGIAANAEMASRKTNDTIKNVNVTL
ncbi:MAG TPA: hypothetical protein VFQ58_02080, partial [Flavisolibacter sp.]|nr:hypothetical protein [Flavisolibacter sp.]